MFSFLLGLIPGLFTTVSSIAGAIANEKIALVNATADVDKVRIQENIAALQAKQAVLIAESTHSSIPVIMQFLIAIGPAIYLSKIFVWDKVLAWGSTDQLSPELWAVVTSVVGFYFLSNTAVTISRIFKA